MDYIEDIPEPSQKPIEVETENKFVPKRVTIEYELSQKIKNISEENGEGIEQNLPR